MAFIEQMIHLPSGVYMLHDRGEEVGVTIESEGHKLRFALTPMDCITLSTLLNKYLPADYQEGQTFSFEGDEGFYYFDSSGEARWSPSTDGTKLHLLLSAIGQEKYFSLTPHEVWKIARLLGQVSPS